MYPLHERTVAPVTEDEQALRTKSSPLTLQKLKVAYAAFLTSTGLCLLCLLVSMTNSPPAQRVSERKHRLNVSSSPAPWWGEVITVEQPAVRSFVSAQLYCSVLAIR